MNSENVFLDYIVALKQVDLWFDDLELDEAFYLLSKIRLDGGNHE